MSAWEAMLIGAAGGIAAWAVFWLVFFLLDEAWFYWKHK